VSAKLPSVILRAGEDRRLRHGHPWAFSNEILMNAETKAIAPGALVTLRAPGGDALGVATFNPHSLIAARVLSRDPDARIDAAFVAARLTAAQALRERLVGVPYYRLIHAEADGLPGLVIDRFGDVAVVQANTAGMDRLLPEILDALGQVLGPRAVILKNDASVRTLEGLPRETRVAHGSVDGPIELIENGARFVCDPAGGQKTGWFYDQRDNRALAAAMAEGARVLDLYSYTGGFAVMAALRGARSVLAVDRSQPALDIARQAAKLNGVEGNVEFRRADVFDEAAALAARGVRYELVIADPPAFVKSRKDIKAGVQGYRKMVRLCAPLVSPGGFLFAASCSHHVDPPLFAEQMRRGLHDAARTGRILRSMEAAPDHPVHPALPESAYLKALLLQLD
jgi:23S rRNA (cytosine1962-C5)-methyltransferase